MLQLVVLVPPVLSMTFDEIRKVQLVIRAFQAQWIRKHMAWTVRVWTLEDVPLLLSADNPLHA